MEQDRQILINLHTSDASKMPSNIELGEIAVRHNSEKPELIIKKSDGTMATFLDGKAVEAAIEASVNSASTALEQSIGGVSSDLAEHIEAYGEYKDEVARTYATKQNLEDSESALTEDIRTAKQEAIDAASAYTKAQVSAATESLTGLIEVVDGKVSSLSAGTISDIATAKQEAIDAASAYTKAQVDIAVQSATTLANNASANAVSAATKKINDEICAVTKSLTTEIEKVQGNVNDANSGLTEYKQEIAKTYATSANTVSAINAASAASVNAASGIAVSAKTEAINAASAYTDQKISGLSAALQGQLDNHVGDFEAFQSANTESIAKAKQDAINSASGYTDGQITKAISSATTLANNASAAAYTSASTYTDQKVSSAVSSLTNSIEILDGKVVAFSGGVISAMTELEEDLTELVNDKVSTAYRFQGSCTYAQLASKEKVNGYVWNVTDANGNFPAGTNYAWSEADKKWDALGGSIDLSPYALSADVTTIVSGLTNNIDGANANIQALSGAVKTFKENVEKTYATSANTVSAINTASANSVTAASGIAVSAKTEAIKAASAYTNEQVASAKSALTTSIELVDAKITAFTNTNQTVINTAVQSASANCGVTVTKNGTQLGFDLSKIRIDCGEF